MIQEIRDGIRNNYKKALVISALVLAGFGAKEVNEYRNYKGIVTGLEQDMNTEAGKRLANEAIKNGRADKKITIVEPKGYLVIDREIATYYKSKLSEEEFKNKIEAAGQLGFRVDPQIVLIDKGVQK